MKYQYADKVNIKVTDHNGKLEVTVELVKGGETTYITANEFNFDYVADFNPELLDLTREENTNRETVAQAGYLGSATAALAKEIYAQHYKRQEKATQEDLAFTELALERITSDSATMLKLHTEYTDKVILEGLQVSFDDFVKQYAEQKLKKLQSGGVVPTGQIACTHTTVGEWVINPNALFESFTSPGSPVYEHNFTPYPRLGATLDEEPYEEATKPFEITLLQEEAIQALKDLEEKINQGKTVIATPFKREGGNLVYEKDGKTFTFIGFADFILPDNTAEESEDA